MMSTILKAISNIMGEVGSVTKAGENKFHGYKYTTAADILHKLQPLMAREGLIVFQTEKSRDMLMEETVLAVTYDFTLAHRDGETWPTTIVRTGMAGARNSKGGFDDKALNKCHTSAHKYFHLTLFEIPTGDYDDADADEEKAPGPRKSSAKAKREGLWEHLQHEMTDARSALSLQRLWDDYRQREYSTWPPAWRQQAEELFERRMEEFSAADLGEVLEDSLEAEMSKPEPEPVFAPNARKRAKAKEVTEFVTPTAVQVNVYRERATWLKGATTIADLKKRGANLEHLSEIEKLTVQQRNNLRELYREQSALLIDKEAAA
jgi:hypothetical protein